MKIYFYTLPINESFYAAYAAKGLRKNGHDLLPIPIEKTEDGKHSINYQLLNNPEWLKSQKVDLIVYHGFSFLNSLIHQGLDYFLPQKSGIPYAVFFYDNPFRYLYHLEKIKNYPHIFFCCDSEVSQKMRDHGYNCYFSPCTFDADIHKPGDINPNLACDLAFAGTLFHPDQILSNRKGKDFYEMGILKCLDNLRETGQYLDYVEFIQKFGISLKNKEFGDLAFCNLMSQKCWLRTEMFEALKDFELNVYGLGKDIQFQNPKHKSNKYLNQHSELPELYRSAKISLSIELLPASVHQRIFEIAGCGGFAICEDKSDMKLAGIEYPVWKNLNELKELVGYYLEHDQERKEISENVHKYVFENHECIIRMKHDLEIINSIYF